MTPLPPLMRTSYLDAHIELVSTNRHLVLREYTTFLPNPIQGDPSGLRLHFVDFDFDFDFSNLQCLDALPIPPDLQLAKQKSEQPIRSQRNLVIDRTVVTLYLFTVDT